MLNDSSSVVARSNDILKKLVLEAKREYEKDAVHRVHIFMADTFVRTTSDTFLLGMFLTIVIQVLLLLAMEWSAPEAPHELHSA